MISIGICDDNTMEQTILQDVITNLLEKKKIEIQFYCFTSGEDLVDFYEKKKLDLVFLDIYMKNINGIETGKIIRAKDSNVNIIFCTASSSYALESYDLFALGYLVKPFDPEKLLYLLEHYIKSHPGIEHKYIIVKSNYTDCVLNLDEIEHIESANKVLEIYLSTGGIVKTYGKLNDIETQLDSPAYLRCHQSFIINMDFVSSIDEDSFVTLSGRFIPIRKREYYQIKKKYMLFLNRI